MLRIEALGGSTQEKNEKRGKLFEKLCRDLLCSLGYEIRSVTRANYAGMEIDIEGEKIIEKTSFIGECKAHSNDISSEKLQKFVGKLHPKWLKNETTKGIFIVLPKLNPHARAYYNDNYKDLKNFILRVLEEEDILKNIFDSHLCIAKDELNNHQGAISDYDKAIVINPMYANAYCNRGISKIFLGDKNSACLDFKKASELGDIKAYELFKEYSTK